MKNKIEECVLAGSCHLFIITKRKYIIHYTKINIPKA